MTWPKSLVWVLDHLLDVGMMGLFMGAAYLTAGGFNGPFVCLVLLFAISGVMMYNAGQMSAWHKATEKTEEESQ